MTDEHTRTGDAQHGRTTRSSGLHRTRRSFLASSLAGGALATSGLAAGQSTVVPTDARGPSPPTDLQAAPSIGTGGVELSWDGVADPCEGPLAHYVVTRDGDRVDTVPAGANRVRLTSVPAEQAIYGVYAVDEDGRTSTAVTVEASAVVSDPPHVIGFEAPDETVAVGETVAVDVTVSSVLDGIPDFDAYELVVSSSTPCAAAIQDVSYPDAFGSTTEPNFADDGSEARIQAGEFDGDAVGSVTLATIELVGKHAGGTELHLSNPAEGAESVLEGALRWSTLAVGAAEDAPEPPTNLSVSQGSSTSVDVSWDGVADPCSSPIDHYVVSVDGSDEATVPVGATRTNVYTSGGERTIGVRAVDESGDESRTVTETYSVATADPLVVFSVGSSEDAIAPGETTSVGLSISPGPFAEDAAMGETTVSVSSPCALSITDVTFEEGAPDGATAEIADDGASATLSPGDAVFGDSYASVEVTGTAEGGSEVSASGPYQTSSTDQGGTVDDWTNVAVSGTGGGPPAVGDNDSAPTDPDDDGLYEDVNGNGDQELADVVDFFQHRDSAAVQENVSAYDFSGNDEIDLGDAVQLFTENAG